MAEEDADAVAGAKGFGAGGGDDGFVAKDHGEDDTLGVGQVGDLAAFGGGACADDEFDDFAWDAFEDGGGLSALCGDDFDEGVDGGDEWAEAAVDSVDAGDDLDVVEVSSDGDDFAGAVSFGDDAAHDVAFVVVMEADEGVAGVDVSFAQGTDVGAWGIEDEGFVAEGIGGGASDGRVWFNDGDGHVEGAEHFGEHDAEAIGAGDDNAGDEVFVRGSPIDEFVKDGLGASDIDFVECGECGLAAGDDDFPVAMDGAEAEFGEEVWSGELYEVGADEGGAGFDAKVDDLGVWMTEANGFFDLGAQDGVDDVVGALEFGDDLLVDADGGGIDAIAGLVEVVGATNAGDFLFDAEVFGEGAGEDVDFAEAGYGE